jgi:glycosyltransferase involved in cell wall biosynthesis
MVNRPLRIAMVAACPFPSPRGTPIRIAQMATALAARGHEVDVVTYHLGDASDHLPFRIHRTREMPSYRKTSPGPSYRKLFLLDPLLALKLRGLLSRTRFDVIHAHHYEGMLVARAARTRGSPPTVFDLHTLLESELPYYGMGMPKAMKRRLGRSLDRRLPRYADHLVAVTDDIRDRLLAQGAFGIDRVSVIPNGVEYDLFHRDAVSPPPRGTPKTVIFTGNLASYQGIDLMLEAFKVLRALRGDVRLLLVTEDSFEPYEGRAAELGVRAFIDVRAVGFHAIPDLLAGADVAVNPRVECDGIPQKLLNYMAAGKPIVSFAGSAKHLVDGELGLVVPDRDTVSFARAIDRLLEDPDLAGRLGAAAGHFVRSTLSWEAAASRLEAVYEGLL